MYIVNCVSWDSLAIELTAGEGNSGVFHDVMQNIPEAKFTSLILCHDLLVNLNYSGVLATGKASITFILRNDRAQAEAKLPRNYTLSAIFLPRISGALIITLSVVVTSFYTLPLLYHHSRSSGCAHISGRRIELCLPLADIRHEIRAFSRLSQGFDRRDTQCEPPRRMQTTNENRRRHLRRSSSRMFELDPSELGDLDSNQD